MIVKIELTELYNTLAVIQPFQATEGSAGIDLIACLNHKVWIKPTIYDSNKDWWKSPIRHGNTNLHVKHIPVGVKMEIPEGYYGQVQVRSGMAFNHGIGMVNGVGIIDSDYRGEIKVPLINFSDKEYVVNPGDRIAQIIILPYPKIELQLGTLSETDRGEGGFGSTGK